ncbi:hypothetical protein BJF79_40125 [Actinomadura sp. CNU-125]|uniref:DUF4232 domain-containing protein n=1 Tax=Actinomadura sp. CNU-125 TaxID=1904961 RepID=UPI00095E2823|nr:DUF4232 domain-containing protein [Actinomadura sp. CNU-125]OLT29853.1 hypothetical protein BJF79_40125 [Actinomadura sp. CNU-125]
MTHSSTRRGPRRSVPAVTGGLGLALLLALTGCQGVGTVEVGSAGAEAGEAAPGEAAGEAGTGGASDGGAEGAAAADGSRCRASELGADLQEQPTGGGFKTLGMLMITNTGDRDCALPAGWASMGVRTGGDYAAIRTTRANHPGAGMRITLRPGRTAFAGLRWTSGPGDCQTVQGFGVSWYGSWLPVETSWLEGPRALCGNSLTQGTLQPSRQGVNFG